MLAERARSLPARTGLPVAEASYRNLVLAAAGPPDRLTAAADLAVRIAGYDDHPVVYPRRIELARAGDGWRVEHEESTSGPPALWDLGATRSASGAHCLVLGLADGPDPAGLVAVGDRAVPAVGAVWGDAWPGRLLLELSATEAQFARLLEGDPAGWAGMAAVTVAAPGAPSHTPADRVLVNPEAYGRLSDFGRQVVVTHEATHVATRADTRAWTPLWLSEGVADWTAYRDSGRTPRRSPPSWPGTSPPGGCPPNCPPTGTSPPAPPASPRPTSSPGPVSYGPQRLVAFYRAVGAGDGQGEDRDRRTDRLLRAELGVGLAEFTRLWLDGVAALKV